MPIILSGDNAIRLCSKALQCNDQRLVEHGTRVGFYACKIADYIPNFNINKPYLYLLSLFHDIGAYKTEEIDDLVKFETVGNLAHSVYGYLFLKHLTPLNEYSNAVLYHHFDYKKIPDISDEINNYAKIINVADRIDIGFINGFDSNKISEKLKKVSSIDPNYVNAASKMLLEEDLTDDSLKKQTSDFENEILSHLSFTAAEVEAFLLMMIYSIDFKSPATMLHSVNTTSVALFLAKELGLNEYEVKQIYTASLIHDIGKVTTPTSILEFNGKLTDSQMEIMKLHVVETGKILKGIMDEEIVSIAVNHHEKLDGTGYPNGLKADELSIGSRIIAVADITSALLGRRSYKESYGWDRTLRILEDMANNNKIDDNIVAVINEKYMDLQKILEERAKPVVQKYSEITKEYHSLVNDHELPPIFYG